MSVVMTMSVLVEETNTDERKKILNFFELAKRNLENSDDIQVSDIDMGDKNYSLRLEGDQHWNLWYSNRESFQKTFNSTYFTISYIEGDAIYVDLRIDGVIFNDLKFSPDRYKKKFFEVLDSENFLIDVKNWAITQVNKKEKTDFELDVIGCKKECVLEVTEQVEKELYQILKNDDKHEFEKYLNKNLNLNHTFTGIDIELDAYYKTICGVIVCMNALKIAELCFHTESMDKLGFREAPIYTASKNNDSEMIELLISKGISPNKKYQGNTPLLTTILEENYDAFKTLLNSGKCNPSSKNSHSMSMSVEGCTIYTEKTPICELARRGLVDFVELIMEYKIDKKQMQRAVIVACENNHEEIALKLLDKIDLKRKGSDLINYPLSAIFPAIENSLHNVTERLLSIDPQIVNYIDNRRTLISSACKVNNTLLIRNLLSKNVDVQCVDRSKYVIFDNKQFLVANTKQAEDFSFEQPTHPLAVASAHGHLDLVKLFIELGVDSRVSIIRENTAGFTGNSMLYNVPALDLAKENDHSEVVSFLEGIEKDLPVIIPQW